MSYDPLLLQSTKLSWNASTNILGIGTTSGTNLSGSYFGGSQTDPLWVSSGAITGLVIQGSTGEAIQFVNGSAVATADFGVYGSDVYFVNRAGGNIFFDYTSGIAHGLVIDPSANVIVWTGNLVLAENNPGIAAGTGSGTSPTISVAGSNNGGIITLTTGTSPAGSSATIATITFSQPFPTGIAILLTPGSLNAAQLSGTNSVWTTGTINNFTIKSGTAALAGATQYIWNYSVAGW